MKKEPKTIDKLDEILADLHDELEDGATAEEVKEIADNHPNYRSSILAFVARWLSTEGSDLSDDAQEIGRTVTEHDELLAKFWDQFSTTDIDPFDALPPLALRDLADRCQIDTTILRKLVNRLIDETTIPAKLVSWLGAETAKSPGSVWSYLATDPVPMKADFFAPSGKKIGSKMSFAAAVKESSLDDKKRSFWLQEMHR